ncbi:branched-chain amino acid transport system II carrier protein [Oscillibacter valericigenes]|nr:branched-chain amino acid transport system II carrier protein [Oscillibacter valericigenes]
MKQKLSHREYIYVASMLFGMFFGAGNLIFPVHMGQMAGSNIWPAIIGFCVTGVGLPLLGVAALGISRSNGLFELGSRVSRPYSMFFTCLLYLTIGPFFAIPRCATTSFTVGLEQVLPQDGNMKLYLLIFSLVFFAFALFFSLKPGRILVWVGKVLNPSFLVFLGILVVVAMLDPGAAVSAVAPEGAYVSQPFFTGFLEGYNTMDALASLAFGIVVVQVIRDLGVSDPDAVAGSTVRAGIFSCLLMALIYVAVTMVGVQSRGLFETSENGGITLAQIAQHYLGGAGLFILAATVTLACLKTSVGLITSCAETFTGLFPKGPTYRVWAVVFSLVSLLFANFGLSSIIGYSVPVLMFLYPLAITLILLSLFGRFFQYDRAVFVWTTTLTLIAALYDFAAALPASLRAACHLDGVLAVLKETLPLAKLGLFWVLPALLGLVIGLAVHFTRGSKTA